MHTKQSFPSAILATHPALLCLCWGTAVGQSLLPTAQKADLGGDATVATINHSLTLLQRLQELLQNGNSSDSVLRVRTATSDEAKVFHTHQLLLSLQSEVFEGLLRNQSVVTLYEQPETAALFEKFIRYAGRPQDGRDADKEGGVPIGMVGTQWERDAPQGPGGMGTAEGMEPTG